MNAHSHCIRSLGVHSQNMRWAPKRLERKPRPDQGEFAAKSDFDLIAMAPLDQWAFPEFYRRHFFGLAGFVMTRVGDVEIAHSIANEAMAIGLEHAIERDRESIIDPPAWIYELTLQLLDDFRSTGVLRSEATARVGLDLPVTEERLQRVRSEAERVVAAIGEAEG